jgi:hypothetical protein
MRDISELKVKQFRIFGAGVIPFGAVNTGAGHQALLKKFGFREAGINPAGVDLVFQGGTTTLPGGRVVVVDRLELNDRRIVLEVSGRSEDGDAVAAVVIETIAELTEQFHGGQVAAAWRQANPIVITHETTCTVTLGFEWLSLASPVAVAYTKERVLPALSSEAAEARIKGLRFAFVVSYAAKGDLLREHGVTLSDKLFFIEPKANTPFSSRKYHTSSPTDSKTHLELVRGLEKLLASRKEHNAV